MFFVRASDSEQGAAVFWGRGVLGPTDTKAPPTPRKEQGRGRPLPEEQGRVKACARIGEPSAPKVKRCRRRDLSPTEPTGTGFAALDLSPFLPAPNGNLVKLHSAISTQIHAIQPQKEHLFCFCTPREEDLPLTVSLIRGGIAATPYGGADSSGDKAATKTNTPARGRSRTPRPPL